MYGIGIKDHIEELRTQARVAEQSRDDWKACAEELAHHLHKYNARYHGAAHAEKHWREAVAALAKFYALKGKQ